MELLDLLDFLVKILSQLQHFLNKQNKFASDNF